LFVPRPLLYAEASFASVQLLMTKRKAQPNSLFDDLAASLAFAEQITVPDNDSLAQIQTDLQQSHT
jgi:hypothetical protein